MRILLNGWFLVHDAHTGSGQYLRRLLEWLPRVDAENEYHVLAPDTLEVSGVMCHVSRSAASDWGKLKFEQFTFPRFCCTLKADLSHVPYLASPLRSPVPLVVTIHDLIPLALPLYRGSLPARLYTALVGAAARGAQRVLTDSQASRADILARLRLPPERVRAVLLAAGPEFTPQPHPGDEAIRRKYDLPEAYVLYVGGFDRRKNLRQLLAAWTWVAGRGAVGELHPLALAGALPRPDGRMFEDLPALARQLGLQETVRFPGPIAPEDLPAVYRGAAAFVYPSRYEGFGLPPLEALACGTPAVACNVSSIPEVVGDAAYLVDPDDARALGAALLSVLVDEKLAGDLREKGLAQAAKFSWEQTARATAEAYLAAARGE
ncbi:MAG: glycosyltransferase family 4 protein [Chloroflexi bacterium]|nr:glycosyltransferase family 4 protein [Chloroflexota bacterium]